MTLIRQATPAVDPWLRVADTDREHVVEQLQHHTAAGRLTLAEFETRADAANRATTYGELAALTADLPTPPTRATGLPAPILVELVAAGVVLLGLVVFVLVYLLIGTDHMGSMMDQMGAGH